MLRGLLRGAGKHGTVGEVRARLDNVLDHAAWVTEFPSSRTRRCDRCRARASRRARRPKTLSSWAAILFTPTLVASVYGMNFDRMPELHLPWGCPFAVALMAALGLSLWGLFRHKHWL